MDNTAREILLNALCTGIISGIGTYYLLGENDSVNYFGVQVSAVLANSSACAIGSVVSDLSSTYILRKIGMNDQLYNGSVLAVEAGVGGLASSLVLIGGGMPMSALPSAIGLGIGSKMAGNYLNDKVFNPIHGFIPLF